MTDSNTPSVPHGGADLLGLRYEQIKLMVGGYRSLTLIYDPSEAEFTDWDAQYLRLALENLLGSAALRASDG